MIIFMLQVVSILGDNIPWELISLDVDCECACVRACACDPLEKIQQLGRNWFVSYLLLQLN